ncbi:hypothetical protein SYNPS1DRAFT_30775 [Syncephalis pseudoplumigaleata]|uniref:SAP domain-containing protein n=1 Tax=Syncephalis pseudoplumigaleata TaxID=1712513 RepID=A0A4P9YU62_9FUNG|nr:hypothetical protein SYNPS1DRAFT_30775 [Syncephalis pseudoplumigaleata]|eukprot:RKP23477.1 hypothetical protein SYNPS1DRAFT_30775 [Syncephalis pseudoplumigaleata]
MDPTKLKVTELRAELTARGITPKGLKADLIRQLKAALEGEPESDAAVATEVAAADQAADQAEVAAVAADSEEAPATKEEPTAPAADTATAGDEAVTTAQEKKEEEEIAQPSVDTLPAETAAVEAAAAVEEVTVPSAMEEEPAKPAVEATPASVAEAPVPVDSAQPPLAEATPSSVAEAPVDHMEEVEAPNVTEEQTSINVAIEQITPEQQHAETDIVMHSPSMQQQQQQQHVQANGDSSKPDEHAQVAADDPMDVESNKRAEADAAAAHPPKDSEAATAHERHSQPSRERERDRDRDRDHERSRDRDVDRHRRHDRSRDRHHRRDRSREASRHERRRDRDRDRDRHRDRSRDRHSRHRDERRRRRSPSPRGSHGRSVTPIHKRKRKLNNWDVPPPGYEHLTAEQAKLSGAFGLRGLMTNGAFPSVMVPQNALGGGPDAGAPASSAGALAARQSRRLYVGNLPYHITEGTLVEFLNHSAREMNLVTREEEDAVLAAHINVEKNFAFVDFRTPELATAGMGLDGAPCQGQALKVRRPKDYFPVIGTEAGYARIHCNKLEQGI